MSPHRRVVGATEFELANRCVDAKAADRRGVPESVPKTRSKDDHPAADALFVNGHGSEFSNIWKQPLKGDATRVTNLREQFAMRFDVSPDGKSIALVRGQVMRDAVLLTGFE